MVSVFTLKLFIILFNSIIGQIFDHGRRLSKKNSLGENYVIKAAPIPVSIITQNKNIN